ncbi:MAG: hypothetical protein WAV20_13185 [Blastocatellia bacterium]
MKRACNAFCLGVFVVGLVVFSRARTIVGQEAGPEPSRPYSVVTLHYRIAANGIRTTLGERVRYVKSNGEWRQLPNDPHNASTNIVPTNKDSVAVFASTDDGVFLTDPGHPERKLISAAANQEMEDCFRSVKCLKAQVSFVRLDQVAGLEVYVLRTNIENHPIEWTEQSYSPKTGYLPLRNVKHFRDGSEDVLEATRVEFRDVPGNLNDDIKSMPIRK